MPKVDDEHRAARRQQILDAATECFTREGFHRTTMQDIIGEAGLSAGAVYGYFKSKDDIVEAISAERHVRERELLSRTGEPAEILRQLAREFLGALSDRKEQKRRRLGVQVWAEALREPRVMRLVRRGIDEPVRLLTGIVEDAQKRGEISASLEPEAVARAIVALFHGFILQQSWDARVAVGPYLNVMETILDALLKPSRVRSGRRVVSSRRSTDDSK
jgi:TetR/AcrR family transcriptional regulator, transcriptional repressor of aconitase